MKKGSPVRLECSATGNPLPNITWTRKNNLLPNGMLNFFLFCAFRLSVFFFLCVCLPHSHFEIKLHLFYYAQPGPIIAEMFFSFQQIFCETTFFALWFDYFGDVSAFFFGEMARIGKGEMLIDAFFNVVLTARPWFLFDSTIICQSFTTHKQAVNFRCNIDNWHLTFNIEAWLLFHLSFQLTRRF